MKYRLLKEISEIKGGKRIPKGRLLSMNPTSHPYIRVVDMYHNSKIELNQNFQYVPEDVYPQIERYITKTKDIILSIVGTIGVVSIVGESLNKANLTENCVKITVDRNSFLPEYIFYYLTSYMGQKQIKYGTVGSVQSKLPLYNIGKIKIPVITLDEQIKIIEQIELFSEMLISNKRMINDLNEYSQLLFHKWFTDFNFPDENGNPYKYSGGKMVEVDGNIIPDGWKIKPINHYVMKTITGDWGKEYPEEDLSKIYCIRGADIPNWKKGKVHYTPIRYIDLKKKSEKALQHGDIMIEISGGSPVQSTGRVVFIRNSALDGINMPVFCSNFSKIIRPKSSKISLYLGIYLEKLYNRGVFFHYESKTTGIKNLLLTKLLNNLKINIPSENIILQFNEIIEPIYDKINQLGINNQLIEETRDLLIKKLIK